MTGPLFDWSDTWQLVINTGTTIVTFLMVFLIQNAQNRDASAIQAKLDELDPRRRARPATSSSASSICPSTSWSSCADVLEQIAGDEAGAPPGDRTADRAAIGPVAPMAVRCEAA